MSTKGQEALRGKGRKKPAVRRKAAGAAKRNQRNRTARDGETRRKMKQWYAVGLGKREARVYTRSQRTLPFKRERKEKNIQNNFLGGGLGNLSQEKTRRVCDAGTANLAKAGSIRKRSAGYAIRNKPGGLVTRGRPIWQKRGAYASEAQGMRSGTNPEGL